MTTGPTHSFLARCRAEPAISALTITLVLLCLAAFLVPALVNLTTLVGCAFLLALVLRRLSLGTSPHAALANIKPWRLCLFFFLEAAVLAGLWLRLGPGAAHLPDALLAAVRYAVLLPPIALLPWSAWRSFARDYPAECLAALIALLTWFPHRIFMAAWPHYSQVLGHSVYYLSRPFVSFLQYIPDATPTLSGPSLAVTILFACSGLQAVKLFQMLFAFVLIVDWNVLDRRRVFQGYFIGLALILLANAVRIALIVILGNHLSSDVVVRYHVTAGWIYFALVVSILLWTSYRWLRGNSSRTATAPKPKDLAALACDDRGLAR